MQESVHISVLLVSTLSHPGQLCRVFQCNLWPSRVGFLAWPVPSQQRDLEGLHFIITGYWSLSEQSLSPSPLPNPPCKQTHTAHYRERIAFVCSKWEVLRTVPKCHSTQMTFSLKKTHCSTCLHLVNILLSVTSCLMHNLLPFLCLFSQFHRASIYLLDIGF